MISYKCSCSDPELKPEIEQSCDIIDGFGEHRILDSYHYLECIVCGDFHIVSDSRISKHGTVPCERCVRNEKFEEFRITHEEKYPQIELIKHEYVHIGNGKGGRNRVEFHCHDCGSEYSRNVSWTSKYSCPECRRKNTYDEYVEFIKSRHPSLTVSPYNDAWGTNSGKTWEHTCHVCELTWNPVIANLKFYSGCPGCSNRNHDGLYMWTDDAGNCKIGICNSYRVKQRVYECARKRGTDIHNLLSITVNDARMHESYLHKKYTRLPYDASTGDGFREFRTLSDVEYEEILKYFEKHGKICLYD
ncbi:hypothetical protein VPFG_00369 [Vibrio phage nt-1]|uniref:Zinc-ribbon domain-containing protein n=1 Tax=Vibrio phage nt-1 TaxID=115992 RepID=R9TF24_9CAUD|nr:hypothetical protein VPFG_00369 [Vibrio phage nt-1]AGN30366.1 hypothetical protein VPFG_00369 [Vibrio phage nt-1]